MKEPTSNNTRNSSFHRVTYSDGISASSLPLNALKNFQNGCLNESWE